MYIRILDLIGYQKSDHLFKIGNITKSQNNGCHSNILPYHINISHFIELFSYCAHEFKNKLPFHKIYSLTIMYFFKIRITLKKIFCLHIVSSGPLPHFCLLLLSDPSSMTSLLLLWTNWTLWRKVNSKPETAILKTDCI